MCQGKSSVPGQRKTGLKPALTHVATGPGPHLDKQQDRDDRAMVLEDKHRHPVQSRQAASFQVLRRRTEGRVRRHLTAPET